MAMSMAKAIPTMAMTLLIFSAGSPQAHDCGWRARHTPQSTRVMNTTWIAADAPRVKRFWSKATSVETNRQSSLRLAALDCCRRSDTGSEIPLSRLRCAHARCPSIPT